MRLRLVKILFCIVFLASCKANERPDPIVIKIWHYYTGAQNISFEKLVKNFNTSVGARDGIIVKAYSQGNISELHSELIRSAKYEVGAQAMPDMFTVYTDTATDIDKLKPLLALDKYFTKNELQEYVESFVAEGRFDEENNLKVFPVGKSSEVFILNKSFWNEFSEKTGKTYVDLLTWEDVIKTAESYYEYTDSLTPQKNDGKAFFGRDSLANYMLVGSAQLGSPIIASSPREQDVILNEAVLRRLWDNYYVPYIKGLFVSNSRFAADDARQGDIIALVCSSSAAVYFGDIVVVDDKSHYIEAEVLPLPNFKNTKPYAVQQGAGLAVVESFKEKDEACVKFIKWITKEQNNIEFAIGSSYMPVKSELINMEKISSYITEKNIDIPLKILKSIEQTIKQIRTYTLYSQFPIANGFKIRQKISSSIIEYAKNDRQIVLAKIKSGDSREKAIESVLAANHFETWYSELKNSVQKINTAK